MLDTAVVVRTLEASSCLRMKHRLTRSCAGLRRYQDLLQRLACRYVFPRSNVVSLKFAIERGSADTEHLAGQCFVTLYLLEDALDSRTLNVFQVSAGEPGTGSVISQLRSRDGGSDRGGQVMEIYRPLIAQSHGPLDAILQFAHISRPVILQQGLHGGGRDLNRCAPGVTLQKPMGQHGD